MENAVDPNKTQSIGERVALAIEKPVSMSRGEAFIVAMTALVIGSSLTMVGMTDGARREQQVREQNNYARAGRCYDAIRNIPTDGGAALREAGEYDADQVYAGFVDSSKQEAMRNCGESDELTREQRYDLTTW